MEHACYDVTRVAGWVEHRSTRGTHAGTVGLVGVDPAGVWEVVPCHCFFESWCTLGGGEGREPRRRALGVRTLGVLGVPRPV
eukprot:4698493-Prymnesium_polylepis.2